MKASDDSDYSQELIFPLLKVWVDQILVAPLTFYQQPEKWTEGT